VELHRDFPSLVSPTDGTCQRSPVKDSGPLPESD
jgi:hypothetical protein